jgi:hypothetical protein
MDCACTCLYCQRHCDKLSSRLEATLDFPNLLWAVSQFGNRYQLAAAIGCSESCLSRRLVGRVSFNAEEREVIAKTLGYPTEWLFQEPQPPARVQDPTTATPGLVGARA